jgi:hypothetical protein
MFSWSRFDKAHRAIHAECIVESTLTGAGVMKVETTRFKRAVETGAHKAIDSSFRQVRAAYLRFDSFADVTGTSDNAANASWLAPQTLYGSGSILVTRLNLLQ